MISMKHFPLFVLICLFAVGCSSQNSQSGGEPGNGLGGANVAGSFPGSSGSGAKAATGTNQAAPSTDPGAR